MKRIHVLILVLLISLIITVVYFANQSSKDNESNAIIRKENTILVPVDMVGENGEPPGAAGGP